MDAREGIYLTHAQVLEGVKFVCWDTWGHMVVKNNMVCLAIEYHREQEMEPESWALYPLRLYTTGAYRRYLGEFEPFEAREILERAESMVEELSGDWMTKWLAEEGRDKKQELEEDLDYHGHQVFPQAAGGDGGTGGNHGKTKV
jgi:hypothetical protein